MHFSTFSFELSNQIFEVLRENIETVNVFVLFSDLSEISVIDLEGQTVATK